MSKFKVFFKNFSTITDQKIKQTNIPITKLMDNYKNLFERSRSIEKILPRKFQNEEELTSFFDMKSISSLVHLKDKISLDSINKSVNDPLWDLLDRGGKRWRPILGLMIGKYLNLNIEDFEKNKNFYNILGCIEILHNATLIIDDVVDNSEFRRNKPCTYKIYGKIINN